MAAANYDEKVICWDLDETLGTFDTILYEMSGKEVPPSAEPVALRYGIKGLLRELSEECGCSHFITTSGTSDYAREVLDRTGLSEYFRGIFGRETISRRGPGKRYKPVAESIGFSSDEEAAANMVVIGDMPGDVPSDMAGLVFIEHIYCQFHDPIVTREILGKLLEAGNGNFRVGFEHLYNEDAEVEGSGPFERRMIDLDNGIKFQVEYRPLIEDDGEEEEGTTPTITNIRAENYERELQPI